MPVLVPAAAGLFKLKTIVQNSSAFEKRIKRRISARPHVFFAVCPPGLGGICEKEVSQVSQKAEELFSAHYKINDIKVRSGGIEFKTRLKTACLANILMGSSTRILMRLASFKADGFRRLEEQIKAIDWELYLPLQALPDIRVTTHKSRLYHSTAIADRISPIVHDRLFLKDASRRHDITDPAAITPQTLMVRGENNRFELSLDMSGTPLYKRGVKEKIVKAPLRETLAFAILTRLGLSEKDTLVDPMCGSGTFSLEGAMMQCALPPGALRSFAFETWPGFEEKSIAYARNKLMAAAGACMDTRPLPPISARDLDRTAIDHLKQTCTRHKAFQRICPVCDDFFNIKPPPVTNHQGVVVLNPPYGIRLDRNDDVTVLYKEIGHKLAADFKGWRAGIVCPGRKEFQALNLGLSTMPLFHGGLDLYTAIGVISR
ncbi:THUMP domain-containing class I SAM-dependent RNA methyltransferase [Desulfobacter curvatus]|uniref:THUMP domain-containing class I SAM-dependent RNA methyltransferase n=1 Tax=Desulfobacter curvatus TaxID=2290 RepID=UPI00146B9B00|nr:RNA methyltransferase [Desulfobacter curvatus]